VTEFCDVAIVGGGYAGTILALHLIRGLGTGHIVVVEPRDELGSGLAYSIADATHCINVPARQLGVSGAPEDRFIAWLETRHPELVGGGRGGSDPARTFVQRRRFGEFVRDRLDAARAESAVTLTHRRDRAVDVRSVEGGLELILASGARIGARQIAIAIGHGPAAVPSGIPRAFADAQEFIGDPWRADALDGIAPDMDVLIVGTGLTMADIAAALLARPHRGHILALSRHGLLARAASANSAPVDVDFAAWPAASVSVYLRRLRDEIARVERGGGSWRDVFTALREQGGALWSKLPLWEKRRFVRHAKSFYDAHRYRMPPDVARLIDAARERGQVEIVAARVRGVRRERGGLLVEYMRRGGARAERRRFGAIVNCTGPRPDLRPDPPHFLGALIARGLAYPDPLGLGLSVDRDSRIYGISRNLFALGPLTREQFGDVIGAPEIMAQAQRLAARLVAERDERCSADASDRLRATSNFLEQAP
jgi:uncharacterized NAD(P)/FAD-binding protein YdhS